MKNLKTTLLCSIFSLSLLAGCSNQATTPILPEAPQATAPVSILSNKGLSLFHTQYVNSVFVVIDKNKDKIVTKEEFISFYTIPEPPVPPSEPEPPAPPSDPAFDTPAVSTYSSNGVNAGYDPDPKVRFSRLDRNKDNRLTLTEVKNNSKQFIGMSKTDYRKGNRIQFDRLNLDKNKSLSFEEFKKSLEGANYDHNTKVAISGLFYTGDVNKNGTLSFSEFEDIVYGIMVASMNTPYTPSPAPVNPPPSSVPAEPVPPTAEPPSDTPASPPAVQ